MSTVSKAVLKSVQRETAWELSSIATLKGLAWWQLLQERLMTIAMLAALYLLSELGVKGEENTMVFIVGAVGSSCVGFTSLISMIMLNRPHHDHAQRQPSDLELPPNVLSQRTFTSSNVDEGAIALTII
ncbi:hypothetical protein TrLO_g11178 [Triparma laevis f. longispina]|nr:hypothetical protein TrLO_g11178 [Triparma laevis f. longispina]